MNTNLHTLLIALVAGIIGGYLGSTLNHNSAGMGGFSSDSTLSDTDRKHFTKTNKNSDAANPFAKQTASTDAEYQLESMLLKIEGMQIQIEALQDNQKTTKQSSDNKQSARNFSRATANRKNLITAGINPDEADDILRRIGQQNFRRLELQNLIQRSNPTQRRQYSKELRELNKNKISLRSEMGDENFDQYLYASDQNNRVKVRSVMTGSPAESSGFEPEDIILSYDNKKILSWPDIRAATIEGEIGSFISVEILRDGEQISLTVPRGTLGVELDATQIEPEK